MAAIKLYRGEFGHVSVLSVASDLVTHAHPEAQLIIWLDGTAGEITIGQETVRLGPDMAAGINPFEPHSHQLAGDGRPGRFLNIYLDATWGRGSDARAQPHPSSCNRRSRWSRGCATPPFP